jgi:hypothetical protein
MITKYDKPRFPLNRKAKILCVICTYIPQGQVEKTALVRSNIPPYLHRTYPENKLASLQFSIACHQRYDAGVAYDIVLVDSSSPDPGAQEYFKTLPYTVHTREDVGFSFGSRQFAYEQYKDQYDYFVFCDQDVVPTKDGWLTELLTMFHFEPGIGAVGVHVEQHNLSQGYCKPMKKHIKILEEAEELNNFEGTFMFTSTKVLNDCQDLGGMNVLPVVGGEHDGTYQAIWNELSHQVSMLEHGYSLLSMDDTHKYYAGVSFWDKQPGHETRLLAPVMLGHVRLFIERDYFSWYKDTLQERQDV